MQIHRVWYDSPGSDNGSNASLNGEGVLIKNTSRVSIAITNFTLRDKAGHVYKFPRTTVGPGKSLWVRTGKGTNNLSNRYWGLTWYVWNNTGDTATLRDPHGRWLDACSWGNGPGSRYC
ncbi:MAG: lamin tail domain-containing protein [Pseudonocardiaceae bacterium]|nr:lamin tail domain-containing protein [Pseudonocardiaceae bacterium]